MGQSFRGAALYRSAWRCALAGPLCDGPLDAHHIIPQRTLKKLAERGDLAGGDLEAALEDGRNGIALCRAHHHLVTVGTIKLTRDQLPESVEAFAEEFGCGAEVEAAYGRSADPDRPVARPALRLFGQLRQRVGK